MDAYLKLSKSLLKLGLNPKELSIMVHLLDIEDYRLYKNEVEDGWFTKSKRELANDCGISDRWINITLDKLVDKGLIEVKSDSTSITQFKIIYRQNVGSDYRQNVALHNTNNNENNINKNINNNLDNNIINKNIYKEKENIKEKENLERKENSLDTGTSYKESEEQNIQPTVGNPYSSYNAINLDNSTIEEIIEDFYSKGGRLSYENASSVEGFRLSNLPIFDKELSRYLIRKNDIDTLNKMFVYVKKNNPNKKYLVNYQPSFSY